MVYTQSQIVSAMSEGISVSEFILTYSHDCIFEALCQNRSDVIDSIVDHVETDDDKVLILSECFNAFNAKISHDIIFKTIKRVAENINIIENALDIMKTQYLRADDGAIWQALKDAFTRPFTRTQLKVTSCDKIDVRPLNHNGTELSHNGIKLKIKSEKIKVTADARDDRSADALIDDPALILWETMDVVETLTFRSVHLQNIDVNAITLELMRQLKPATNYNEDIHPLGRLMVKVVYGYCTASNEIINTESLINHILEHGPMQLVIMVNSIYRCLMSDMSRSHSCRKPMNFAYHVHPSRFSYYTMNQIFDACILSPRYDMAIYIADMCDNKDKLRTLLTFLASTDYSVYDWNYTLRRPISNNSCLKSLKVSIIKKCSDPSYAKLWSHPSHVDHFFNYDSVIKSLPQSESARAELFNKHPKVDVNVLRQLRHDEINMISGIEASIEEIPSVPSWLVHKIVDEIVRDLAVASVNSYVSVLQTYDIVDVVSIGITDYALSYLTRKSKDFASTCQKVSHHRFQLYSPITVSISHYIATHKVSLCTSDDNGPYLTNDINLLFALTRYIPPCEVIPLISTCTPDVMIFKTLCHSLKMSMRPHITHVQVYEETTPPT